MSGHTPGPWRISGEIDARYINGIGDVVMIRRYTADDNRYVALATLDAMGFNSEVRTSAAECQANARLIAAAPEMLAALKNIRISNTTKHNLSEAWRWVDAAIQKAEGTPDDPGRPVPHHGSGP